MTCKINTILNEVKAVLIAANTSAGNRVFRRLEEPLPIDQSPAISIRYVGDASNSMGAGLVKRDLTFQIDAMSRAANAEEEALELIAAVQSVLYSSSTVKALVARLDNERGEAQSDDAESGACLVSRQYRAIYNTVESQL